MTSQIDGSNDNKDMQQPNNQIEELMAQCRSFSFHAHGHQGMWGDHGHTIIYSMVRQSRLWIHRQSRRSTNHLVALFPQE